MNKKFHLLESLEEQLSKELTPLLIQASKTGADLFSLDEYNPNMATVREFVSTSQECLELRTELFLDSTDTLAYLYLQGHAEATDKDNAHRLGPKRLAKRLLEYFD